MSLSVIDKLSNRSRAALKWILTALSGVVTTGMIIVLES